MSGLPLCDTLYCGAIGLSWFLITGTQVALLATWAAHSAWIPFLVLLSLWLCSSVLGNGLSYLLSSEDLLGHVGQASLRTPLLSFFAMLRGGRSWTQREARQAVIHLATVNLAAHALPLLGYAFAALLRFASAHHRVAEGGLGLGCVVHLGWVLGPVSKDLLRCNAAKAILSWPGIIAQMLWRVGTLCSRLGLLAAYADVLPLPAGLLAVLHALLWLAISLLFFRPRKSAWCWRSVSVTLVLSLASIVDYAPSPVVAGSVGRYQLLAFYFLLVAEAAFVLAHLWLVLYPHLVWLCLWTVSSLVWGLAWCVAYQLCFHPKRMIQLLGGEGGFRACNGLRKAKIPSGFAPPPVLDVTDSEGEAGHFSRRPTVSPKEAAQHAQQAARANDSCDIIESEF